MDVLDIENRTMPINSSTSLFGNSSVNEISGETRCNDSVCPEQTTMMSTAEDDILLKVLNVLEHANFVLLPTFLLLGLTGNILTIIIMNSRRYAHLTSQKILIALACSDSILLLTQPLNKMFVIKLTGIDLRALSDFGCKAYFVLFKTGKMTSSWFVVLLCFERFIAVWFPFRAKFICSTRNTLISIALVYVIIGGFNSVWSYASKVVGGICFPDMYDVNDAEERASFGRFLITGCSLYSLIPTFLMLILTPLIIKKLMEHKRKRKSMANKASKSTIEEARITAMLLGIVTAYIILILPVTFLHLSSFLLGLRAFGDNPNGFLIFRDVSQILEQVNYSINFFLYVLTSKQFRDGLRDFLGCKQCKGWYGSFRNNSSQNSLRPTLRRSDQSNSLSSSSSGKPENSDSVCTVSTVAELRDKALSDSHKY